MDNESPKLIIVEPGPAVDCQRNTQCLIDAAQALDIQLGFTIWTALFRPNGHHEEVHSRAFDKVKIACWSIYPVNG